MTTVSEENGVDLQQNRGQAVSKMSRVQSFKDMRKPKVEAHKLDIWNPSSRYAR